MWDTFNKEHHKKVIAVLQIEELLDIKKEECQQKCNNLMGQKNREIHQKAEIKSGGGLEEHYETKWKFFHQLKGLEVRVRERAKIC